MLSSLMEQKHPLGAYAVDYELPVTLTSYQWGLIENILTVLAPFEELTKEASSSTATAADVIPSIVALKLLLTKRAETDHKSTLLEAVEKRFSNVEQEPLYCLATIIDPRYKDLYFSNTAKHTVQKMLQKVLQTETGELSKETRYAEGNEECTEAPAEKIPRRASLLLAMHNEILGEQSEVIKDTGSRTALEMQSYLSEPQIPRSEQPVVYWRTNKSRFPALAEVARAYLSAPCTSVESERLFSSASHVLDEKRNRQSCKEEFACTSEKP
nr:zinc finger BED domain-containing protein 4-like [Misgurnus anguillicaudatus]